jgi:putative ABC transport system permease protein
MILAQLAWKNISGNAFRSGVVGLCALLVAGFVLSTTLIMRGAERSLRLALERLGADIVVVPEGTEARVETALLMGVPAEVWMPDGNLAKVAAVPGVERVSPQLYLSTLENASCCSAPNMFLVAYDPETDFTVQPWLEQKLGGELGLGEAVGGDFVFVPEGEENIMIYGYFLSLKANMEPTGTGLDQSMFFTFETARDVARISKSRAVQPLEIPDGHISAVMVKAAPGQVPHEVAVEIYRQVPGVTPIESPNMFQSYRRQMSGLLRTVMLVLGFTWFISVALIALVFSMAANERRREMGVLRALGATRRFVLQIMLAEAGLLALSGGILGAVLAALVIYLFRRFIITSIGVPFLFPDLPALLAQVGAGLLLALASVTLAAWLPAYRTSHQDPAVAMRE